MRPNNHQLAIANYIACSIPWSKRQAWTLPAGVGKSRIIAVTATVALMRNIVKSVHILVPNLLLENRELTDFDDLFDTA